MHEGEDEGVPKKQMVQRDNSQRKRELRRSEEEANSVRPQHFFDAEKGRTEMVCQSFALSVYRVCVCVCVSAVLPQSSSEKTKYLEDHVYIFQ